MAYTEKRRRQYRSDIDKGLDKTYKGTDTQTIASDLATAKIIIFSDHHRGTGDGADDFCDCAKAYSAALGYYLEAGYTLILLGDAEDLWECRPGPVIQRYRGNLLLESEFLRQTSPRYYRVFGNHDDLWRESGTINKYFRSQMPNYPQITVTESIHLKLTDAGSNKTYAFFLVHGHQGTLDSDRFESISRIAVRYVWRPLQRLFKFKSTSPAKDEQLRSDHDIAMYNWALKKWKEDREKTVLVAGHTHQPVFSSRSHVAKLSEELIALQEKRQLNSTPAGVRSDLEREIAEKRAEVEYARAEHGDSEDGSEPCYFNTGCCSFSDGDITGIEIADGKINLVRWPAEQGRLVAKVLESADIRNIFE